MKPPSNILLVDDDQSEHPGLGLRSPRPASAPFSNPQMDFIPKAENSKDSQQLVHVLACSAVFRTYQRAFEDATGLPLTLRAVESFQLAHHGSQRQNGFCALLARSNRSCAACLQLQQRVCEGVHGGPSTLSCTFGLRETAVAVRVGQNLIAYLQTGQVFFKPPTPGQTQRAIKQIRKWGLSLDAGEAARRYNETPVIDRREYQATVRLLQFFAVQLGATANQIVMQQQTTEPLQITRARHFIEEHYQDDLTLAAVARQAFMSVFYFSRRFKQVTGLNFAPYLSRFRVEKAKNLLLNRNYRVSEIAYGVGFQSLTQFNRVFKQIAGDSPSEYRQRLPTNGARPEERGNRRCASALLDAQAASLSWSRRWKSPTFPSTASPALTKSSFPFGLGSGERAGVWPRDHPA